MTPPTTQGELEMSEELNFGCYGLLALEVAGFVLMLVVLYFSAREK